MKNLLVLVILLACLSYIQASMSVVPKGRTHFNDTVCIVDEDGIESTYTANLLIKGFDGSTWYNLQTLTNSNFDSPVSSKMICARFNVRTQFNTLGLKKIKFVFVGLNERKLNTNTATTNPSGFKVVNAGALLGGSGTYTVNVIDQLTGVSLTAKSSTTQDNPKWGITELDFSSSGSATFDSTTANNVSKYARFFVTENQVEKKPNSSLTGMVGPNTCSPTSSDPASYACACKRYSVNVNGLQTVNGKTFTIPVPCVIDHSAMTDTYPNINDGFNSQPMSAASRALLAIKDAAFLYAPVWAFPTITAYSFGSSSGAPVDLLGGAVDFGMNPNQAYTNTPSDSGAGGAFAILEPQVTGKRASGDTYAVGGIPRLVSEEGRKRSTTYMSTSTEYEGSTTTYIEGTKTTSTKAPSSTSGPTSSGSSITTGPVCVGANCGYPGDGLIHIIDSGSFQLVDSLLCETRYYAETDDFDGCTTVSDGSLTSNIDYIRENIIGETVSDIILFTSNSPAVFRTTPGSAFMVTFEVTGRLQSDLLSLVAKKGGHRLAVEPSITIEDLAANEYTFETNTNEDFYNASGSLYSYTDIVGIPAGQFDSVPTITLSGIPDSSGKLTTTSVSCSPSLPSLGDAPVHLHITFNGTKAQYAWQSFDTMISGKSAIPAATYDCNPGH